MHHALSERFASDVCIKSFSWASPFDTCKKGWYVALSGRCEGLAMNSAAWNTFNSLSQSFCCVWS